MNKVYPLGILLLASLPLTVSAPILASESTDDAWQVPRTSYGHPVIEGVWANNSATPFERPKAFGDKAELTDEEVAALNKRAAELRDDEQAGNLLGDYLIQKVLADPNFRGFDQDTGNYNSFWLVERTFDKRTSVVVDPPNGRIPDLTPEAKKRIAEKAAYDREHFADGPENLPYGLRCINFGLPKVGSGYNSYQQIYQTEDTVAIVDERGPARIIPLDGRPHLEDGIRLWNGDARGRWEGDTLVVETRNFSEKSQFRGSNEGLHLIERYTRTAEGTLTYEVTVTDPTTWVRPWTARIPLEKSDDPIFEYACHEGNHSIVGTLRGARFEESQAATSSGDD